MDTTKGSNKSKYYLLNQYKRRLHQNFKNVLFVCPICHEEVEPVSYENHCDANHGTDSKTQCVWCHGQISWQKGKKFMNMDHVYRCAKSLLKDEKCAKNHLKSVKLLHSKLVAPFPLESMTIFNNTPEYRAKSFFGHLSSDELNDPNIINFLDVPTEYILDNDDFHSKETVMKRNRLTFENEDINRAAFCVQFYLETYNTGNSFHHVMVRRTALSSLWEVMKTRDDGHSKIFPFYCWCDGGDFEESEYRQHMHIIVVSRGNHFKNNVWPHIKPSRKPCKNYSCRYFKSIESPMHLVYTIRYLCARPSKCRFNKPRTKEIRNLHFYHAVTLPRDHIYCLVTLWNDGIRQYIETAFQNISPEYGDEGLIRDDADGRWKIKYKYLPDIPWGLVLPVKSNLIPEDDITDIFLCLNDKRKIYFAERNGLANFSPSEQAIQGNLFFNAVENDYLTLRPKQQTVFNKIYHSMDRIIQDAEISRNDEIKQLKTILRQKDERLEEEMDHLQKTVVELRTVIEAKDTELDQIKQQNETILGELVRLRRKIVVVEEETDDRKRRKTSNDDDVMVT